MTDSTDKFIKALKNKNYQDVLKLTENDSVYQCFLKDYISDMKKCISDNGNKLNTSECIQIVIDNAFKQNLYNSYNPRCIELLVKIGITNAIPRLEMALREAVKYNSTDLVKFILNKGVIPSRIFPLNDHRIDLYIAIQNNNKEIVELLLSKLKYKLDSNKSLLELLDVAITTHNNEAIIKLILKTNINLNEKFKDNQTILYKYVTMSNSIDVVKLLLEAGANPNIIELQNMGDDEFVKVTPLVIATIVKNIDLIELLLKYNADINIEVLETPPLISAIRANNIPITKLLLKNGANPNIKDIFNIPPVMWAVGSNNIPITDLLLEYKGDVNAKTEDGNTALMVATDKNNAVLIDLLLAKGADPKITNNNGLNAEHFVNGDLKYIFEKYDKFKLYMISMMDKLKL